MPRRRATKASSRAKPKLQDGEEGAGMSKAVRKSKLEALLRDFDVEGKIWVRTKPRNQDSQTRSMFDLFLNKYGLLISPTMCSVKFW